MQLKWRVEVPASSARSICVRWRTPRQRRSRAPIFLVAIVVAAIRADDCKGGLAHPFALFAKGWEIEEPAVSYQLSGRNLRRQYIWSEFGVNRWARARVCRSRLPSRATRALVSPPSEETAQQSVA